MEAANASIISRNAKDSALLEGDNGARDKLNVLTRLSAGTKKYLPRCYSLFLSMRTGSGRPPFRLYDGEHHLGKSCSYIG